MKILLATLTKNLSLAKNLAEGFKYINQEVKTFVMDRGLLKKISIFFIIHFPSKKKNRLWRKLLIYLNRQLLEKVSKSEPQIFLSIGNEGILGFSILEIKKRNIKPVIWVVEEPAQIDSLNPYSWADYSYYDKFFVIDELWAQSLQYFSQPKIYLPLAGDEKKYKPLEVATHLILFTSTAFKTVAPNSSKLVTLKLLND